MVSRIYIQKKGTKKQPTGVANFSAQGMLQQRPFVVQSKNENKIHQQDLKTSLIQTERYGHHFNQIKPTNISANTAIQTKLNTKQLPESKTTELPQAQDGIIQGVWVNYKNGKVGYSWGKDNKESSRPSDDHVWMDDQEFVTFKNAGKRKPSNKWTDKTTGINYYSADGKNFTDKDGNPVTLANTSNLLDRRRLDRQEQPIALYDVTTYQDAKDNETRGDNMEHDHIPAGESVKKRILKEGGSFKIPDSERQKPFNGRTLSKDEAYKQALAIEIRGKEYPGGNDHQEYSPTWGYRQRNQDTATSLGSDKKEVKLERPQMDAELPGAAFHRDTDTMLHETHKLGRGQDDYLKQLGAYRYLYRQQIKLDNISPASQGYEMTGDPLAKKTDGGGVSYTPVTGKTQGALTDAMFLTHSIMRLGTPGGIDIHPKRPRDDDDTPEADDTRDPKRGRTGTGSIILPG
jgi:hypothetical protein